MKGSRVGGIVLGSALGLIGLTGLFGDVRGAWAQGPGPNLQFSLNRGGPVPVAYSLTVSGGGDGVFQPGPSQAPEAPGTSGSELQTSPKKLRVGPATVKKLFAAVPMVEGGRCETHSKSIAQTGVKTLRYQGTAREGQCTYNYSDDDRVNQATNTFEALAETMQYGNRLQAKLRFDRLGLDAELETLEGEVTAGRALEVGNIAPVLNSIAEDERVMDRARRRAERLLAVAVPGQGPTGADNSPR